MLSDAQQDDDVVAVLSHTNPHSNRNVVLAVLFAAFLVIGCIGYLQYSTNERQMNTNARLVKLEDYVAQAKVKRDAQNKAINDELKIAACGFLDRLPASPLWDPMREQYGCGPGIPADEYPAAAMAVTADQFYQAFPSTRDQNN